ncbi:sigma-70 family RNA polymerase sigma factor [Nakamurella silvestris]|nr:sigma-70 family RNA polymerase sigma factor [Nakamurella silvestris]
MGEELLTLLPSLMGLAWALTGSRADSEELVQSAVASAIPRWERIDSPRQYLRRTMINLHRDSLRRRLIVAEDLQPSIDQGLHQRVQEDHGERVSSRIDVDAALARLPAMTRTVLILRFVEDLTSTQIGRTLGQPPGTIRRIIHQGVKALRQDSRLFLDPDTTIPESGSF